MTADTVNPNAAVVLLAAGQGERLREGKPKALVSVAGGNLIYWCLRQVLSLPEPVQVILVAPPGYEDECRQSALEVLGSADLLQVVTGGLKRQDSVGQALGALLPGVHKVLVHDVARAFAPVGVYTAVLKQLDTQAAVIPVLPVVDTIKQIGGAGIEHPDRESYRVAQTPQGFWRQTLEQAYQAAQAAGTDFSDDAGMVAAIGTQVGTVAGADESFKITHPWDLEHAEILAFQFAAAEQMLLDKAADVVEAAAVAHATPDTPPATLIGIGTDFHAFSRSPDAGSLRLACLEWEGCPALEGHSDADAVAHAVVDALLSAAGLGDIGLVFGVDNADTKGRAGFSFLTDTYEILLKHGLRIANLSVQIIGSKPYLGARRYEAEAAVAAALGGARVSISATTTDGMGFLGREEGIAVLAAVQLYRP